MSEAPRRIVDCDVHCAVPSSEVLYKYLPGQFREFLAMRAPVVETSAARMTYPPWVPMLQTTGSELTLEALQAEVLTRAELAILNCYYGVESFTHPYLAPALATALNRWLADDWLDRDPRLLGSALITPQHTVAAVEEIHRVAADPRFVQILVPARSAEGYGQQRYWPIWEAAAEHDLAVAIAYGGVSGTPTTPVGWLSSFWEEYGTAIGAFQANLTSLVASGILNRRPNLRFVVLESGWTWLPATLWRFDEHWRALQREVPWLQEAPSTYVRRHFRFTTQPIDAPPTTAQLGYVLDQIGGPEMLMFGSDYPHRYDAENADLLELLDGAQAERVMWANAWEWYGLADRVRATPTPAGV